MATSESWAILAADPLLENGIMTLPAKTSTPLPGSARSNSSYVTSAYETASSTASSIDGNTARARVMIEFQRTTLEMSKQFLESQQRVMLAYLQSSAGMPAASWLEVPAQVIDAEMDSISTSHAPTVVNSKSNGRVPTPATPPRTGAVSQTAVIDFSPPTPPFEVEARSQAQVDATRSMGNTTYATTNAEAQLPASFNTEVIEVSAKAVAQAPPSTQLDAERLVSSLIEIVSDRTGYPPEMLDPELDLEADLGIDSIKRVEILNSFRKLLPVERQQSLEGGIEQLASVRSLQGIIDWIRSDLTAITVDTAAITAALGTAEGVHA